LLFTFRVLRVFRGSSSLNSNSKTSKLVASLLDWFPAHARDLPWRRTRDPYAIWVSEVMLQQTQVKTVIPYWERWMRELPTIEALAKASAGKIHKLWEGLGYYSRVRNLQKAAQQILASQSAVAADVSPLHLKAGRSQSRLTSAATVQRSKPRGVLATRSPSDGERIPHTESSRLEAMNRAGTFNIQHSTSNVEGRACEHSLDVGSSMLNVECSQGFMGRDGVKSFPTNFEAVLALPGIGRYTAGAICSIAFNQPTPILDGNVIRVLTRVYGIASDPREKQTNAQLWQLAEELVTHASRITHHAPRQNSRTRTRTKDEDDRNCSHLNQSLMELGALLCTPRSPNCPACPVQKLCIARKEHLHSQLPNLGKRAAATERRFLAFVVERNGRFIVHQRPAGAVNAHLWEFPNVEVGARVCDPQHAAAKELGFKVKAPKSLHTIKHSITRYRITLEAWRAELASPSAKIPGRWLTPKQLHQLAFTSAHKKILQAIAEAKTQRGCGLTHRSFVL
jgi:adenine-specific DNA glycosylase